jgi:hypothetical protein
MFKHVIKYDDYKIYSSKILVDVINYYLSQYLMISKNHNEIIDLLLSKKKLNFYYFNEIFNLCDDEISHINIMNNELK